MNTPALDYLKLAMEWRPGAIGSAATWAAKGIAKRVPGFEKLPYQVNAARMGHTAESVGPMGVRDLEALHRASGLDVHDHTVFGTSLPGHQSGTQVDQSFSPEVLARKTESLNRLHAGQRGMEAMRAMAAGQPMPPPPLVRSPVGTVGAPSPAPLQGPAAAPAAPARSRNLRYRDAMARRDSPPVAATQSPTKVALSILSLKATA